MAKFFDYGENGPAQLTGLSTGSWTTNKDLDLGASYVGSAPVIPATATGIILRFVIQSGTAGYNIGYRHPDSATNRIDDLTGLVDGNQADAYCGINAAHEIDIYIENAAVEVYVLGYFAAGTSFFTDGNQHTFVAASTNTWHSIDLSSYLSSGAIFAIIEVSRNNFTYGYNFRHPDSADNRTTDYMQKHSCLIVPVDASRNVELWSESIYTDFVLIGEVTSNATSRTSGGDVSLNATGSYQTVDFSGLTPPANAKLAVVEVSCASYKKWAVRRYGDTSYPDLYEDIVTASSLWIVMPMIDADDSENERCQAKIETTDVDFYVWGYLEEAAAGGVAPTSTIYGPLHGPFAGPI